MKQRYLSDQPSTVEAVGILLSITACTLFALMPAYVQLLKPYSGYVVAGQRILWSSILLLIFLLVSGQLKTALAPFKNWRSIPGLMLGSFLIGLQWWIFVWAPLNNHTLDVSLGYFLLPIVMVLIGSLFFKEKLRPLQWMAVALACIGIVFMLIQANGISWVSLLICLGYPPYFLLRRIQVIPTTSVFFIENLLLLPIALWAINHFGNVTHPFDFEPFKIAGFAGLGLLGSIPMLCFITASRRLPITIFGLLNYLEPALIFIVGYLLLGEHLSQNAQYHYFMIMAALALLAFDGYAKWRKPY